MTAAFRHVDGTLHCEGVSLTELADRVGTPLYVYSKAWMQGRLREFQQAFSRLDALFCYALKANSNLAVIRTLARAGAGADTVSMGEIRRALAAGVEPEKIVFAGVAKTDDEIRFALQHEILQLNAESVPELRRISAIAASLGVTAPVALRVNPDIAAGTHEKISTGRRQDKFGIVHDEVPAVLDLIGDLGNLRAVGLHLHIGSQITSVDPFEAAYARSIDLFVQMRAAGHPLSTLDLGGGFGVTYRDERPLDAEAYAGLVRRLTRGLDCRLMFEPGRALVAEAGVLVSRVIYRKVTSDRQFLILDAGMNTLIRPAMYDAYHEIVPVVEHGDNRLPMDVVGPICESSDVFGRGRLLPPLDSGDLVAFRSAGAYGAVMASDYNSRPSPAEVLVDGERWALVKPHRHAEEQFADESIPGWLEEDRGIATA
ncbi:MAG: diaminopimelate decarboxylase [Geminicoccaceae bacterium]|nr:diaminopimelate decarboxylase [Geminicoccaceae bacterium]